MSTAKAIIKSAQHHRRPDLVTTATKPRHGRRTKETPNHRCMICDNKALIETAPNGMMWASFRTLPFYGCSYLSRLSKAKR